MESLPVSARLNVRKLWTMYASLSLVGFLVPLLLGLALSSGERLIGVLALSSVLGAGPLVGGLIRHLRGPIAIEVLHDRIVLTYRSGLWVLPFSDIRRIRVSGNPSGGIGIGTSQGKLVVFNVDAGRGTRVAEGLVELVSRWALARLGPDALAIRDLKALGPPDLELLISQSSTSAELPS